jgi:ketopantoate reductase
MKVCVVGAGAIGGLLCAKLALAGNDVTSSLAARIWQPSGSAGSN